MSDILQFPKPVVQANTPAISGGGSFFHRAAEGLKTLGLEVRDEGHRLLFRMPGHNEWVVFHYVEDSQYLPQDLPGKPKVLQMDIRHLHEVYFEATFHAFSSLNLPWDHYKQEFVKSPPPQETQGVQP